MIVPASEVQAHTDNTNGDYLVGLGDGYVVEVEHDVEVTDFDANNYRNSGIIGQGFTVISFDDAEGVTCYLICTPATEIEIQR